MRRVIVAVVGALLSVGVARSPAVAGSQIVCTPDGCFTIVDVGPIDGHESPESPGDGGGGADRPVNCKKPDGAYPGVVVRTPDGTVVIGATRCNGAGGPGFLPIVAAPPPPPPPAGGDVARSAFDAFPWINPDARFTPDVVGAATKRFAIVHLPLYFTIPPAGWSVLSASSTACNAGGCTTASVTARPVALRFEPGDGGGSVSCAGPGVFIVSAEQYETASRDCSYTYDHSSTTAASGDAFGATVSVEYEVSWVASNGGPGTFPNVTRSTGYAVRVGEVQAVGTGS